MILRLLHALRCPLCRCPVRLARRPGLADTLS